MVYNSLISTDTTTRLLTQATLTQSPTAKKSIFKCYPSMTRWFTLSLSNKLKHLPFFISAKQKTF